MAANNNPVQRWCFTWNNYTDESINVINAFFSAKCTYGIFGKEVGETGTPHLQGFFVLRRASRFTGIARHLPGVHLEKTRATTQEALDYCKKDGDYVEYGHPPVNQGQRSDLQAALDWGESFLRDNNRAPSERDIALAFPGIYLRYPRFTRLFELRAPVAPFAERDGQPNEWQLELEGILDGEADDRSILFYVDEDGGKGKTWFQKYYFEKHPATTQILSIGKRDDLAYAVQEHCRVFFFNIPRGQMQFLQYSILESIKDRHVMSTKYESRMKRISTNNHVVVFSNEYPDHTALTADRIVVKDF